MFQFLSAFVAILPLVCFIQAKPAINTGTAKLTLPWGTYIAEPPKDEDRPISRFKNVRFGKAPVGNLRFAKPEYPDAIDDKNEIQDNSFGPSCIQADLNAEKPNPPPGGEENEDCLFLDIYFPSDIIDEDPSEKLPVVVYLFGGAYIFGGKDTVIKSEGEDWSLYDGQGIFEAADYNVIWVVANYRLGAFGWLAGNTVERNGSPNAALYDQRLVFQFVQDYIDQIHGDSNQVSAWGNSAGAGSLVHHLTAFGGDQQPLFSQAVLWSPAYQWAWDRQGTLEDTYRSFATAAGCGDQLGDLECLRNTDPKALKEANQKIVDNATDIGLFPFGPAVDGSWVKMLPAAQFQLGQFANCNSLIVSHVWNEAGIFIKKAIDTPTAFTNFLKSVFPGDKMQKIRDSIETRYPSAGPPFLGDQQARVRQVVQDSTFVCNSRQVYDAYKGKTYVLKYDFPPATHGSDLLAASYHQGLAVGDLLKSYIKDLPEPIVNVLEAVITPFAQRYQRYFGGHAVSGDPNEFNYGRYEKWEIANDDDGTINNALKATLLSFDDTPFFDVGKDLESTAKICDFWKEVAQEIGNLYIGENSSADESGVFNGLFGVQVQDPKKGTPVIPDL